MVDLKQIFLLCMMFPLAFAVIEDLLFIKYHIHVTNDLPPEPGSNVTSLYLHCKSKNKDIGDRAMYQGDDYTWDTRVNFWGTTLFFCNARWLNKKQRYFEAFKATRDEDRCLIHQKCMWSVREDGIYFSNTKMFWKNEYPW